MLGIPSKSGVVPTSRLTAGVLEHAGDSRLVINEHSRKPVLREIARKQGRVKLEFEASGGSRMTARYGASLSRSVLKSALECAWVDHGERLLDPCFDAARAAVLHGGRPGFFVLGLRADPDSVDVTLTYQLVETPNGETRIAVVAKYLGIAVATDSHLAQPPEKLPDRRQRRSLTKQLERSLLFQSSPYYHYYQTNRQLSRHPSH